MCRSEFLSNGSPKTTYISRLVVKTTSLSQEMAICTHVLAIPYPLQGHINPMVQLCKNLITKGVNVTLITTASTSSILQKQAGIHLINIETIPDSTIQESDHLDLYEIFIESFRASMSRGLPEIIQRHINSGFPLKALLYDSVLPWILDIAQENGLKGAVFFTQPCTVCTVFYHVYKGTLGISPDEASDVSLPGLPVLGFKDLPSLVYDMGSYTSLLRLCIDQFSTFEKADWRLFNTFKKLEDEILKWMANQYPILSVGPTIPFKYTDKRLTDDCDYGLSLFKPNAGTCMKWLDTREDQSVVYVSFGSLLNLGEKQMEELAHGLLDCKYNFLWVVRDPNNRKLPHDFKNGLIVNWAPQLQVLSHRAVGCFVTHCGWNSTIEALSLGVPVLAMPQWTDQTTNAKLIVDVWQAGVRVKTDENGIVTREEVVARVVDVMQRERGREVRRNALKWKDMAIEAVSEGGSSDKNIEQFVMELLSI